MKHLLITILLLFSTCCLSQKKELIYLWPGKVPGEMKEKQPPASGGHGYGLRPVNLAAKTWPQLAETWLKNILFPKK